ncbi:glycosyltransferase family 4 protein [Shimia ponticola]|uniref:glycosyltransferase family 4 protein n=1 Tax=Shimia ponticola TaxID=2582893 RepID=UPI0011BEFFED|nr:glycosyltransferase family 4 protein [Shimia ponticola]
MDKVITKNATDADLKACVAVGVYYFEGQTFVNRHIRKLFGGNTIVVTGKWSSADPIGKTVFARADARRSFGDKIAEPFVHGYNRKKIGASRMPFGRAKRKLKEFLVSEAPDVILAEFGPEGVFMCDVANEVGIPIFCYFRGSDASSRIRKKHIVKSYKYMLPKLTGVISVSQFLLDNLASVGFAHPNSVVIPSGVDVRRFQPQPKVPGSCLALGRFVEKKAPLLTIKAFAEVLEKAPHATLTMVGGDVLWQDAVDLVNAMGLQDKVHLPGALPHEEVRQLLATSEVFVQHSITAENGNTEGLPTAIQEAMATGCLVVTTNHAGIPEAIDHGESGWMVKEHDFEAYRDALEHALTMPDEEKARVAMNARLTAVERFDNDLLLTKLEQHLAAHI